jgi:hypothetical protein
VGSILTGELLEITAVPELIPIFILKIAKAKLHIFFIFLVNIDKKPQAVWSYSFRFLSIFPQKYFEYV